MSLSLASIVSVAVFVIVGYACFRNGLFSTLVMLFVMVFSAMTAVALLVPLWNIPLFARMGWYAPPIIFMATFLISVGIMQTVANYLMPPRLVLPKAVDVGGGVTLGLVNAYFLTGLLMVAFAMFPGTGETHDKVVFLHADVFFARAMAWASRQSGSARFDADTFLEKVKREKYQYSLRDVKDREVEQLEGNCAVRLHRLYNHIDKYVTERDRYPQRLEDLSEVMPRRGSRKRLKDMMMCPATHWRYRLFPVPVKYWDAAERQAKWERLKEDKNYILVYDAIGGGAPGKRAGHMGRQLGNRPVLMASGDVEWLDEEAFQNQLQAQYNRRTALLKEAEEQQE